MTNYSSVSIISDTEKVFAEIISNRIKKQNNDTQAEEQAGFRTGDSTTTNS